MPSVGTFPSSASRKPKVTSLTDLLGFLSVFSSNASPTSSGFFGSTTSIVFVSVSFSMSFVTPANFGCSTGFSSSSSFSLLTN
jgi:hypothetical protein